MKPTPSKSKRRSRIKSISAGWKKATIMTTGTNAYKFTESSSVSNLRTAPIVLLRKTQPPTSLPSQTKPVEICIVTPNQPQRNPCRPHRDEVNFLTFLHRQVWWFVKSCNLSLDVRLCRIFSYETQNVKSCNDIDNLAWFKYIQLSNSLPLASSWKLPYSHGMERFTHDLLFLLNRKSVVCDSLTTHTVGLLPLGS
ncbi:uncharacterized protein MYCFIDRAFT_177111 [Pseudocercospora fijiensis CIRAD86]|uniref:Uncharacterized protein n=1 Tax=Pseudocercospora fijiensis (strain CIRAD86) TaxID=383855 RepID=M3A6A1_PSEFD|nr:uncharacterized protein MYCFIDRAFT_177111 [Pseudocercospora fijiensis CIRAD86]EME80136.1 hypothetical protein MYCFIDRAFT_177111 [Pseudocercospora fijiensis CIRAD86]